MGRMNSLFALLYGLSLTTRILRSLLFGRRRRSRWTR